MAAISVPQGASLRLGTTRFRQQDVSGVHRVAFSADSKLLAVVSTSSNARIQVLDATTGDQVWRFDMLPERSAKLAQSARAMAVSMRVNADRDCPAHRLSSCSTKETPPSDNRWSWD
jgi:WD40 repeat protein